MLSPNSDPIIRPSNGSNLLSNFGEHVGIEALMYQWKPQFMAPVWGPAPASGLDVFSDVFSDVSILRLSCCQQYLPDL